MTSSFSPVKLCVFSIAHAVSTIPRSPTEFGRGRWKSKDRLILGGFRGFVTQLERSPRNHSRSRQAQALVSRPSGSDFVTLHQRQAEIVAACEPSTSQTVQKPERLAMVVQVGAQDLQSSLCGSTVDYLIDGLAIVRLSIQDPGVCQPRLAHLLAGDSLPQTSAAQFRQRNPPSLRHRLGPLVEVPIKGDSHSDHVVSQFFHDYRLRSHSCRGLACASFETFPDMGRGTAKGCCHRVGGKEECEVARGPVPELECEAATPARLRT